MKRLLIALITALAFVGLVVEPAGATEQKEQFVNGQFTGTRVTECLPGGGYHNEWTGVLVASHLGQGTLEWDFLTTAFSGTWTFTDNSERHTLTGSVQIRFIIDPPNPTTVNFILSPVSGTGKFADVVPGGGFSTDLRPFVLPIPCGTSEFVSTIFGALLYG